MPVATFADERGPVVHQALDTRDRRLLHHEVGERHLDVAGIGVQALRHFLEQRAERVHRDLALVVQDLDEARHVRAFEIVRQVHVHVEIGDGVLLATGTVLDAHRVIDILHADPVDRDAARVGTVLHVLDADCGGLTGPGGHVHHGFRARHAGEGIIRSAARPRSRNAPASRVVRRRWRDRREPRPLPEAPDRVLQRRRIEASHFQAILARTVLDESVGNSKIQQSESVCPALRAVRRPRHRRHRRQRSPRSSRTPRARARAAKPVPRPAA